RVDGFLELLDFAAHIYGDLAREVTVGHGDRHVGDVADLVGEVAGHGIDVVRQVLPRAGDAAHFGLTAELAFRADLASHAADLRGEGVQLVHHRVDGVLEFEDFALNVHGDLAREVAARHGGRHFGDVADLGGEVGGH